MLLAEFVSRAASEKSRENSRPVCGKGHSKFLLKRWPVRQMGQKDYSPWFCMIAGKGLVRKEASWLT